MKTVKISTIWVVAIFVSTLFLNCENNSTNRQILEFPVCKIVENSGWKKIAKNCDRNLTLNKHVEAIIKDQEGKHLPFSIVTQKDGKVLIDCESCKKTTLGFLPRIYFDKPTQKITTIEADSNTANKLGLIEKNRIGHLVEVTRLSGLDRSSSRAVFRWSGCVFNQSNIDLDQISLRATLLLESKGRFLAAPGVIKSYSKMSGVPKTLNKNDYLCVDLLSGKIDIRPFDDNIKLSGIVEEGHKTASGTIYFDTIIHQKLHINDRKTIAQKAGF